MKDPPPGISVRGTKDNCSTWNVTLRGPPGSHYEGGVYALSVHLPTNYPYEPPVVSFVTKIYHPNISSDGVICLEILKSNWSPVLTIGKILRAILALLYDPNIDDPLDTHKAEMYKTDRPRYMRECREWVGEYATE